MERIRKFLQYKYLISALFIVIVFVMFILNVGETLVHVANDETEKKPEAIAADSENIEAATYPFININGLYQGLMQRNYMYDVNEADDIIRTQGKYLISAPSEYKEGDVISSAECLDKTSEWLEQNGIEMLYVQAASKMTLSDKDSMIGIANTSYKKVNSFLNELNKRNIDYADTRKWILSQGMSAFYRTDHHWTTETCSTVAAEICSLMNEEYGFEINEKLYDKNSFNVSTTEEAFLGAEGRRTGIFYAGLDDFSVITPDYDTDFAVEINTKEGEHISRSGSFEDSVMDSAKNTKKYSFEDSAYYSYWGGDYSSVHVENRNNKSGKSVVIIKDSYGIPVSALMTGAFGTMDMFDIRYYNEKISITQAIREINPDAVVFIYGSGYLDNPDMFSVFE